MEEISVLEMDEQQRQAVRSVLSEESTLILGGPGVGKSAVLKYICEILKQRH